MKERLFKKENAEKLLVFYLGWGMDESPFVPVFVKEPFDVLFIYDYRKIKPPSLPRGYKSIKILAWSSGVPVALKFHENVLCVAGTGAIYHARYGIPPRVFDATLCALKKDAQKTLLAFYRNMFDEEKDFYLFMKNRPKRMHSQIIEELEAIKEQKIFFPENAKAIVTSSDRIIPAKNQERFWNQTGVKTRKISASHFPFYRFSLSELLG
ncbi:pimeloyl-ACP methyl esterase BioG family protein [Thermodesulfatator atlanticus]